MSEYTLDEVEDEIAVLAQKVASMFGEQREYIAAWPHGFAGVLGARLMPPALRADIQAACWEMTRPRSSTFPTGDCG